MPPLDPKGGYCHRVAREALSRQVPCQGWKASLTGCCTRQLTSPFSHLSTCTDAGASATRSFPPSISTRLRGAVPQYHSNSNWLPVCPWSAKKCLTVNDPMVQSKCWDERGEQNERGYKKRLFEVLRVSASPGHGPREGPSRGRLPRPLRPRLSLRAHGLTSNEGRGETA